MMHQMINLLDKMVHFKQAQAHCDIPCKIYDPSGALLAALSCVRMIDLIHEVGDGTSLSVSDVAKISRLVQEKEKTCSDVKEEIRTIWGDYFKAAQFEQVPDVHTMVHDIMMQASKCKQGIDRSDSEALVEKINRFAEAFWLTKGVSTYRAPCPYPPALETVYPNLKP
ncbi:MAG: superoxide dismutase, Ni [Marinomonas sp.]|uniref:Superoxide dismutase, Ni n=1 Tax=Marinomonas arenicola TaxID=569601 RepID=A0ABU9G7W0_9GAMM|nr:superoxide dismutase, Ni [Marinomonas sp. KMM3893]